MILDVILNLTDLPGMKLHSTQLSLDAECYQEDVLNFIAAFHKWMLLIQENPFQLAKWK